MESSFRISRELVDRIFVQAREEAPREACGMLGGKGLVAAAVYPTKNVDASDLTYCVDPAEAFKIIKRMRADGLDLIAGYHSHPLTEAYPSATDRAKAGDSDLVYVIVSLRRPDDLEIRAFKINEKKVKELPVEIA